jgi:ADP-heptose:LPS heptosyltransferase
MRLIIVGDREARARAEQLSELLGAMSLNLAGELAPGPLAALLTNSRMLVSMQGGASVLALALHLPNLVLHREAGKPISEHLPSNRREIRWAEATPASAILAAMDDMLVSEPAGAQVNDPINLP